MVSSTHIHTHIVGAGLTGLSAAHHLNGQCTLHERNHFTGGHVITLEENGYRFDRTGHLLHLRNPEIRRWIESLLQDIVHVKRISRVFSHGRYTRYPYQANTYGLPSDVAYECLEGYFAAMDAFDSSTEPEHFEAFCLKHFGEGFSRHFMLPYNRKLWGVDLKDITASWCSRFVPLPNRSDILAGAVGLNNRELGYNTHFIYPKLGIGELPKALTPKVHQCIQFNSEILSVNYKQRHLVKKDGQHPYDALLWTAPLDTLIPLLENAPAEVTAAGKALRCNPLWYLDIALNAPCGVDLHWAYVPEERYPFYRVGCYSNFSASMAPAGKASLYVELASRKPPHLKTLLPEISQGLIDMQIIEKPSDIAFVRARRIDHAYVVFDHAYFASLEVIKPFLLEHNIKACGRYGAWNYSSMEDALIFGREAAQFVQSL